MFPLVKTLSDWVFFFFLTDLFTPNAIRKFTKNNIPFPA